MRTNVKITWCPGCGNYSILNAFEKAVKKLTDDGLRGIVIASGIGCHGKIVDYIKLPSFHVIHGRVPPFLTGLKIANPDLIPVGFVGDGDALNCRDQTACGIIYRKKEETFEDIISRAFRL